MAKIISLLFFSFPILLWSNTLNHDSISSLIPKDFTGQIVIKQNNKFVFRKNFGPKERVFKTPINDSTVFNIGQVSQTMIAYFFKNLFDNSQIQPTDKVKKYIISFPYENIQIKHLLKHQSGLPHLYIKLYHRKVYNNWNLKLSDRGIRFDNEDILNILTKEKPALQFTPGDSTAYSDVNYLILTSLLEEATQISFPEYATRIFEQKFMFKPILSASNDTVFNKAYGYKIFPDSRFQLCENLKTRGLPFDDGTYGNQHIYLSASNLANWGQFIFNQIDVTALKKNPNKEIMGGVKYDKNLNVISKNGAFGGTSSKLIFIPINKTILAINTSVLGSFSSDKTLMHLLEYLQKEN